MYEIVFPTDRQQVVAKLLIKRMKENAGVIGKTEMSLFATALHDGTLEDDRPEVKRMSRKPVMLSYNKRQFYDRILTPMKSMGLIDYDMYKKVYRISDRFNRAMIKVGLLWLREINKQ